MVDELSALTHDIRRALSVISSSGQLLHMAVNRRIAYMSQSDCKTTCSLKSDTEKDMRNIQRIVNSTTEVSVLLSQLLTLISNDPGSINRE
jgi:hypothetical protein